MGEVAEYLDTIDGADRDALERVYAIARDLVPLPRYSNAGMA